MELLSNSNQALQRFMQTFVLAPEGSVANKFYAYKDIFVTKPQEESDEEVEEPEERQQTPEVVPDDSGTFCDQTVSSDLEEHLEEPVVEPEPSQRQSWSWSRSWSRSREPVPNIQEDQPEPALEEAAPEHVQKSASPALAVVAPAQ